MSASPPASSSATKARRSRHNFGWTLVLLAYLIVIGVGFYFVNPALMSVVK